MGWLRRWSCASVVLALAFVTWPSVTGARQQRAADVNGRQLFRTHCATCHGASGRGDGPMAPYLRVPPANLTSIAAANHGVFPADAVHRAIDGRRVVRAHGDSAMPIWGDALSPTEKIATERIRALVDYLESIQARPGND